MEADLTPWKAWFGVGWGAQTITNGASTVMEKGMGP